MTLENMLLTTVEPHVKDQILDWLKWYDQNDEHTGEMAVEMKDQAMTIFRQMFPEIGWTKCEYPGCANKVQAESPKEVKAQPETGVILCKEHLDGKSW